MLEKHPIFKNGKNIFIAVAILFFLIGIFLRTYHFRDWLYFYPDQARDATIAEEVVRGEASWPLIGPIAASSKFKIGPVYYYFQIASVKIFGLGPEKAAFPDLFFGILSIPLFYYFFSRYFGRNLSLALTGLFAVSFFAIRYSRFAWNPNPLPFFSVLFLLSCWKLSLEGVKTSWKWLVAAGISIGIGIQLHTLSLLIFPAVFGLISVFVLKKDSRVFKKIIVIFLIALFLNIPQIIDETRTSYANSRSFLENFSDSSQERDDNLVRILRTDLLFHSQAYAHILTSLGNRDDFDFWSYVKYGDKYHKKLGDWYYMTMAGIISSVIFFAFGIFALFYYFRKETDKDKKYFLGILILYFVLTAIVMHPVMSDLSIRYFIVAIFFPFIFLGFFVKMISEKLTRLFMPILVAIFSFAFISNFLTLFDEAKIHEAKERSRENYVVLGEIEPIRDYILTRTNENPIYYYGEGMYMRNFIKEFKYLFGKKGVSVTRIDDVSQLPLGKTIFVLSGVSEKKPLKGINNFKITDEKKFGRLELYEINGQH